MGKRLSRANKNMTESVIEQDCQPDQHNYQPSLCMVCQRETICRSCKYFTTE